MNIEEYERIIPHTQIDGMIFYTPNKHCAWRVDTLYTKEPDTIEWLKDMKPGEVLYDVGANIGLYSVFAAKRGVEVYAFEPESQNYAVLCRNIVFNKLTNCTAYPICLSDGTRADTLRLSQMIAGGSCHSFGEDMDFHGNPKQFAVKQGSISMPMAWIADLTGRNPTHIKIDVDGFEHLVLHGAGKEILGNCESILCEMDSNRSEHMEWQERLITGYGFKVNQEQIDAARRSEGTFKGIGNVIFRR